MAREQRPEPPQDDIPSWVMTFSDVITLLMTFFILLLTFATSEPESFERMQISLFGGGGGTGIAGEAASSMDQDTVLMRHRPRSGRITDRGSEMPPLHADPSYQALSKGIAGLEQHEDRPLSTTHAITFPLSLLVDGGGAVTSHGAQQLRMLALQMRKHPLRLDVFVDLSENVDSAVTLAEHLTAREGIDLGRVGVGLTPDPKTRGMARLVVTRDVEERSHAAP